MNYKDLMINNLSTPTQFNIILRKSLYINDLKIVASNKLFNSILSINTDYN